jgi:hypothetical protein
VRRTSGSRFTVAPDPLRRAPAVYTGNLNSSVAWVSPHNDERARETAGEP